VERLSTSPYIGVIQAWDLNTDESNPNLAQLYRSTRGQSLESPAV